MSCRCHLCDDDIPTDDLLGHIRVMHPDVWADDFQDQPLDAES